MFSQFHKTSLKALLLLSAIISFSANADESKNSAFKQLGDIRASQLNNATDENFDSFYLLRGFELKNDDVISSGKSLYQQKLHLSKKDFLTDYYHQSDIFCRLNNYECFELFINSKDKWQSKIDGNENLIERYQLFLNKKPAINIDDDIGSRPRQSDYAVLKNTQRLFHLQVLSLKDKKSIKDKLIFELSLLRNQLRYADTLTLKMAIVELIHNNLQMMVLSNKYFNVNFNAITHLTADEKSLRLPIAYDFAWESSVEQFMSDKKDYHHITVHNDIANYMINQIEISEKSTKEVAYYLINYQEDNFIADISRQYEELKFMLATMRVDYYLYYTQQLHELNNVINIANYIFTNDKKHLKDEFGLNDDNIELTDNRVCILTPKPRRNQTKNCLYL